MESLLDQCSAFRETFLSAMPPEKARIFREFGETVFEFGLEMSRYSPPPEILNNRFHLVAILADLGYIANYLDDNIEPEDEAGTADEARLASVVASFRPQLSKIIAGLESALTREDEC